MYERERDDFFYESFFVHIYIKFSISFTLTALQCKNAEFVACLSLCKALVISSSSTSSLFVSLHIFLFHLFPFSVKSHIENKEKLKLNWMCSVVVAVAATGLQTNEKKAKSNGLKWNAMA